MAGLLLVLRLWSNENNREYLSLLKVKNPWQFYGMFIGPLLCLGSGALMWIGAGWPRWLLAFWAGSVVFSGPWSKNLAAMLTTDRVLPAAVLAMAIYLLFSARACEFFAPSTAAKTEPAGDGP
jgi:hypothetical protein